MNFIKNNIVGGEYLISEKGKHSVEMMVGDLILMLGKANRELYELRNRVDYLENLLQKPVIKSSPDSTLNLEREMAQ
ncbi:hypothetical protein [Lederbergia galactosidilytica]|uniref:Uncharacterized protein n=2 Tax=Lederbergia galactosidilytica TaxID=217031 RepID=A0A177ZJD0_9BACI|nr:hypothetical protein [Lederbergia galactosidilytica]OAK67579.1 hypothetical protein ABB05_20890 [Lederbergia galactosidilytica]